MSTASGQYLRTVELRSKELERMIVRGDTPEVDSLVGWEFRGTNTSPATRVLGIRRFLKGFYREEGTGRAFGYNVPVRQGPLTSPWTAKPRDEEPKRFGFFSVGRPDPERRDNAYLHALLLDYGGGGNRRGSVPNTLRDYLVRVEPGSDDLLLGRAFVAAGPAHVPVGYFVLERLRPTTFRRPPLR